VIHLRPVPTRANDWTCQDCPFFRLRNPKQIADIRFILNGDMKIRRRDAHVAVPRGIADLGQGPAASQGAADICPP